MYASFIKSIFKNRVSIFLIVYYLIIGVWWLAIFLNGLRESAHNYFFGLSYAVIALVGGGYGLVVWQRWGAWKSAIGRGIIFISLGLLSFAFGQLVWSYYNIVLQVEVPYPSIADIGYVSTIPLYFLGMFLFAKAAGAKYGIKAVGGKIIVVLVPIIVLGFSYYFFLADYEFDFSDPVRILIDFGYPLGQALTISVALVAFLLSNKFLGGIMKSKIQFLIFALVFQYATDFLFLYRASQGTYYNGGLVDFMYATSFLIMALVIVGFNSAVEEINNY